MSKARRIAVDGILAALYFSLSALTITTNNLQLRFTALALILAALIFGTLDACAIALVGELLYQLLLFGLTVTTPVWLLPPVLHALLLGLSAFLVRRLVPERRQSAVFFLACIVCGLCNAVFNTAALYLDSRIFGYYQRELIFGVAFVRLAIAVLTAAVTAAVALPLVQLMHSRR